MFRTVTARGRGSLEMVTELLQRSRLEHPTAGLWEAADLQWWSRVARSSDDLDQTYWVDTDGAPVAAVILTEWSTSWGCDPITVPGRGADLVPALWSHLTARIGELDLVNAEVAVRDDDPDLATLVTAAGWRAAPERGAACWMDTSDRASITESPPGYRLLDRSMVGDRPHHFIRRSGPDVAERLAKTTLYRPDLDLFVTADDGTVAAYGLFWHDPVTGVGMVEPMRTEAGHEGRGLARHVLTNGLDRLARLGATRLKVYVELDNTRAVRLYTGAGFEIESTVTIFTRPGTDQSTA